MMRWALLALALSCGSERRPHEGLGRRLAQGEVLSLRSSPDGAYLALLHHCLVVNDRTLPPGSGVCDLAVLPTAGGPLQTVASGVTTLPGGFAWGPSGHVLSALGRYRHEEGTGELVVWSGERPRRLATDASFFALDRAGSKVGWVAQGQLYLAEVKEGPPQAVAGAEQVATFEFGAEGSLLARRAASAGGELFAVSDHTPSHIGSRVRDYAFAGDGSRFAFTSGAKRTLFVATRREARPPRLLGQGVASFLFSPSADVIAYVAEETPARQGVLLVAPLGGGAPVRIASRVSQPRFGATGTRLAWLQDFDPRSRTGTLAVGGPKAKTVAIAKNVSDFDLAPDASSVAFLTHETAGGYSVDLGLSGTSEGAHPVTVARGVFGFAISPDARWLYYRTACVRQAEACDLMRVPVQGALAGLQSARAEPIAQGVKSFQFAPGRLDRLLLGWSRSDRVALDLAIWEQGRLLAVDTYALPGSAQFVGGDPRRIAYAVVEPGRAGAYLAEIPLP
ncbi:MAG TPA: hypothetical protein VMK12_15040 [Anaeromyxobacteraceae bacterium]|nr:hypothetical protein [Anaeromyxobacteraceae bacterium]